MSSARRRHTLRIVVDRGSIAKSELIDAVAECEYGVPPTSLSHQQRKRVQVSLSQAHLPKLADYDAIDVDGDTVTTGPTASRVLAFDADSRSGPRGLINRAVETFR